MKNVNIRCVVYVGHFANVQILGQMASNPMPYAVYLPRIYGAKQEYNVGEISMNQKYGRGSRIAADVHLFSHICAQVYRKKGQLTPYMTTTYMCRI